VNEAHLYIGCAGWSIPSRHADRFDASGSHLERYAATFSAVEINSSFYSPHQRKTYSRWAQSVPADFRFAVKVPKAITHESRLREPDAALDRFIDEVGGLGDKLGPILVQLPPSLPFADKTVIPFFESVRQRVNWPIVCEPRHASWFKPEVEAALKNCNVGRVAADPAIVPSAADPGGTPALAYFRLHGSPRMYYSAYGYDQIADLARRIKELRRLETVVWCIFDNTAAGEAILNAIELRVRLSQMSQRTDFC
jgi:uncharacterized protein YecE (DUF72 family)